MGYNGMSKLLDLSDPPTAVFATSDGKALGCMNALQERNYRIPEDMSLVGYDDLFLSKYISPGLTTLNQNSFAAGRRAAEIITFEWSEDSEKWFAKDEIIPELIVRETTAPPRQS